MTTELEEYEFHAEEILSRLRDDFPAAYVEQTGGGTATLYIHKEEGDIPVTAGPGSFNWGAPNQSRFFVGEFYAGMDDYKNHGEEFREEDEMGPPVPIGDVEATPEHFDRIAALLREYHGIYNSGQYPR